MTLGRASLPKSVRERDAKTVDGSCPEPCGVPSKPDSQRHPGVLALGGEAPLFPRRDSREPNQRGVTVAEARVALSHRWLRSRLSQYQRRSSASAVTFLVNRTQSIPLPTDTGTKVVRNCLRATAVSAAFCVPDTDNTFLGVRVLSAEISTGVVVSVCLTATFPFAGFLTLSTV